ncbi:ATP-binding cassette domain-containing protein [Lachnobacterium bovis]|uniref:ABC transporter ATP-binding protein/permease n=1 Tax=Lachnobacterium bovis TaxID=140626 RepID=UPI0003B70BC2|nr:ATP-binding cassette domain-containing protein [Lachnobacterium bovis]
MIRTRLVNLLDDAKKYIYYQILLQFSILILRICMIFMASSLVDTAIKGDLTDKQIAFFALKSIVLIAICCVCERYYIKFKTRVSLNVKSVLREKIFQKLVRLGMNYDKEVERSKLVQLAVEGVEQLEVYFSKYLSQFLYSIAAAILIFICVCTKDILAGIILLVFAPLIPLSIIIVYRIAKRLVRKQWKNYTDLGSLFLENLQGLMTLKIYQADKQKAEELVEESERYRKSEMKVLIMQLNSMAVMNIMTSGGTALGIIVALVRYHNGKISFGSAFAIFLLAVEFFVKFKKLSKFFNVAMKGMAASDKILAFLDLPEEEEKGAKITSEPIFLKLDNVCFSYEDGQEILDKITLNIRTGNFIAFVGKSGCGKSILAKILSGQLSGYTGKINIQGKELSDVNIKSLNENMVVVTGDSYIFKGNIRDNLLLGKPDATDEMLNEMIERVGLTQVLEAKEGLDTVVEEAGANFSSGQRQRIAIARALLKDAPFYIFDEATSNIDKDSEEKIMAIIKQLAKDKTIILISQRLENVVDCDNIYVFENGKMKESGLHEELLEKDKIYAQLYNKQKSLENYSIEKTKIKTIKFVENNVEKTSDVAQKDLELEEKRGKIYILKELIKLIKPLFLVLFMATVFGILGYLCAISLTLMATYDLCLLKNGKDAGVLEVLLLIAFLRGILNYIEQYCNHYMAFKALAIIRTKVFNKLRKLCPAKYEEKDKGHLISLLTSDIELLEVFYAHTVPEFLIGCFIVVFVTVFVGEISIVSGGIVCVTFILLGFVFPFFFGEKEEKTALEYRNKIADINSFMLTSLRGIREILQYSQGEKRLNEIADRNDDLSFLKIKLSRLEEKQKVLMMFMLLSSSTVIFCILLHLMVQDDSVSIENVVLGLVAILSSFEMIVGLSNFTNNMPNIIASGTRIIGLLSEQPKVHEIKFDKRIGNEDIKFNHVSFEYDNKEEVLKDVSFIIPKNKIIGINGKSGCGKSTILKLLMNFWNVEQGDIEFGIDNIKDIDTTNLRDIEAYVGQETYIFNDTIENNILLANPRAEHCDIVDAAKKASLHKFIKSLPQGYDTVIGERGVRLSDGQKQRIGLARAFLHNPKILLLDEPTSNVDSINEGIILNAILKEAKNKTVVIVSHKESTLDFIDEMIKIV